MNIGIDIVEHSRILQAVSRSGAGFVARVLIDEERQELGDVSENIHRFSGIWAAKEAAVKALGSGFRDGISFHDIQIQHSQDGAPCYFFSGAFKRRFLQSGYRHSALSISHCQSHAVAVAVFTR